MPDDTTGKLRPERWREVFAAADRALALGVEERAAFIDRCSRDDRALGAELAALLAGGEASSALDSPAAAFAVPLLDTMPPELDHLALASRMGPYRIVGLIGRGGMGTVYLAERADDQYRKRVALKLLPSWSAADEHRVRRFIEERQILAALEHPDIARLLDGGVTADGLPWFAMEYVEGTPIDRYCDEHELPIERRLELFCRVCAAVQYAHRNLVVHRDLKPANILVRAEGSAKLLDFGIAKLLTAEGASHAADLTQTNERFMTPLYASPEQVRGEAVSTVSDVYALGVLLYRLLVGQHPYRLPSLQPHAITRAILEQEPERPSIAALRAVDGQKLARRLRGDLEAIVLKAMEKDQWRRYSSVEQLEADVRRYLAGLPVVARPASHFDRAWKFARRHRIAVGAYVALALLTLGFTLALRFLVDRLALQTDRADVSTAAAMRMLLTHSSLSPDSARDSALHLSRGTATAGRDSVRRPARAGTDARIEDTSRSRRTSTPPFQRPARSFESQIAFMSDRLGPDSSGHVGHQEVFLMNPDGSGQTQLTHSDGLLHGPAISPDGRLVAYGSRYLDISEIFVVDVNGGEPVQVTHMSERLLGAMAPSWSPDGKRLAFSTVVRPHIWVIDLDGKGLRQLTDNVAPDTRPVWSPRGDKIAFMSTRDGAPEIYVMNADGRNPVRLTFGAVARSGRATWAGRPSWSPDGCKIAFSSNRDGNLEIYVTNVDGSGLTRLTSDSADDVHPSWSPDGRQIAFASSRELGHQQIFVMNADGSDPKRLTDASRSIFNGFPNWGVVPGAPSRPTTPPKCPPEH
jgi:Tol biopolymer transport system component/serine/threonine protein kinase